MIVALDLRDLGKDKGNHQRAAFNLQAYRMNLFQRAFARLPFAKPRPLHLQSTRAERGAYGESLAAYYCRRTLGYRVITRNWRGRRGELDLICRDGAVLVFIEVRTRAEDALVSGYYSIDANKKAVLHRTCRQYLKQLQSPPKSFRFDIIDVALSAAGVGKVRHYPNIPLFHKHYTARNSE